MTESEANAVIDTLGEFYPHLDWPDAALKEFTRRIRWLDIDTEQAKAAMLDQLVKAKGFKARRPEVSDIYDRLAAVVQKPAATAAQADIPRYNPDTPPVTAYERELCQRFDADPNAAVFQRLRAKGITPFVATRGMRGKPESEADFAAAGTKHGEAIHGDAVAGEIANNFGDMGLAIGRRGTANEKLEAHESASEDAAFRLLAPKKENRWGRIEKFVRRIKELETTSSREKQGEGR